MPYVHAKTAPKNLLDKFAKISKKQSLQYAIIYKGIFLCQILQDWKKWKGLSLEFACLFGILLHFLLKLWINLIFVKNKKGTDLKVLDHEDSYANV